MTDQKSEKPATEPTVNGLLEADRLGRQINFRANRSFPQEQAVRPALGAAEARVGVNACSGPSSSEKHSRVTRQLEILAIRSLELADQVATGELPFLETIDTIYDAAVEGGLVNAVGDKIVQATIAACFANARQP
jgi:hypothetical protein